MQCQRQCTLDFQCGSVKTEEDFKKELRINNDLQSSSKRQRIDESENEPGNSTLTNLRESKNDTDIVDLGEEQSTSLCGLEQITEIDDDLLDDF
mmetsp:Transcript_9584/g.13393  ORF Transcript_9584/g.13393 Transcript_9584/m.13393 type:complete len:94 (-) Transcript_9584:31-312(-)